MNSTYGQFCPVAKAAELFAERWTPLIVRELILGSHRFSDLERGVPRIPRALLVRRLRELERAGIVERRLEADARHPLYYLTRIGLELEPIVMELGIWGQRWYNSRTEPDELDPALLVWDMHRRIHRDRLPPQRVVVRFDFTGACQGSYWMLLEPADVTVCWADPGFEADLAVTADSATLHDVWMGRRSLASALADGRVELDGPRPYVRAFPGWLALSSFAHITPASAAAAGHA